MDLKNQNTVTPEGVENSLPINTSISQAWNPDGFEFKPMNEIFDFGPNTDDQVAEEFRRTINEIVPKVNEIIPSSNLEYKKGAPGLNSFEGFSKVFDNPNSYMAGVKDDPLYLKPMISGARSSGFDRIADHHNFKELGWNPLRDNEKYYNDNSSAFWDLTRATKYWAQSLGTGFMSSYRSFGDFIDDDSYWLSADYESSDEFEEATRLGSSTRGGFAGFSTNLFLQTGYTVGILSSIAAEELALAAATTASEGIAAPAFLSRTMVNFGRSIKNMANLFDVGKALKGSKSILDSIRSVENAKDLWDASRVIGAAPVKFLGNVFTPETMAVIKSMKSAENTAQGMTAAAKFGKGFGAFYKDMRSINYAMSEGKMEAGFVFNEVFSEGLAIKKRENGGFDLSQEQLKTLNEDALKAATETLWFNAPAIFLTNQLVLGTALRGFSPTMRRIFSDKLPGFAKNIIRSKPVRDKATGVLNKGLYVDVSPKNFRANFINLKKLKSVGAKGTLINTAHGLLRYSAASIGEGLQEVYQEGVQVGVVDYHRALMENPMAPATNLMQQSFKEAVNSQMSGQGLEVFASGFLMGGLVQGPQKLFFEIAPEIYQNKKNPEKFAEYEKNKIEFLKVANEVGDKIQENPFDFWNNSKLHLFSAKEGDDETKKALYEDDNLGFRDAKDDATFMHYHFLMTSEADGLFREQFQDLLNLNDEDLKALYPDSNKPIEDVRNKIQKSIDGIKEYKKKYNDSFDIIQNPINYNQYEKGKRKYNDERIKHAAIEHARMLYLFANDAFEQANKRRYNIENTLITSPVMNDLASNDLTVLLSVDSINLENNMLIREISNLQKAEKPDSKLIKEKQAKLKSLIEYRVILESIYDEESKTYDRDKSSKLKDPLVKYLKTLGAINKKGYIKRDEINGVIAMLVDHNNLDTRAQLFDRTVALFSDPNKILNLVDRISDNLGVLFSNTKKIYVKSVEQAVMNEEMKQLTSQLESIGVVPDPDQFDAFLKSGNANLLTKFHTKKGILDRTIDKEIYDVIQSEINVYNTASNYKPEITEAEEVDEFGNIADESPANKSIDESKFDNIISEELGDDVLSEIQEETPDNDLTIPGDAFFTLQVLNNIYNDYKIKNINKESALLTFQEWVNTNAGNNVVRGLDKLKALWFNSLKASDKTEEENTTLYKSEEGFQDWILENKNDRVVSLIMIMAGFNIKSIESEKTETDLESIVDTATEEVIQIGPNVNIVKRKVINPEDTTDFNYIYELVDNNNISIEAQFLKEAGVDGIYLEENKAGAWAAYTALLKVVPKTDVYSYDGIDVKYGDELENVNGDKFIVLGADTSPSMGQYLKLIPFDKVGLSNEQKKAAMIYVKEKGFSDLYSKPENKITSITYSTNMTKLDHRDINGVYAIQLTSRTTTSGKETIKDAEERLQKTLSLLSAEDLESATVTIRENVRQAPKAFQIGTTPENNLIQNKGDKYTVLITLSPGSIDKVKSLYGENFNGDIAFIRNDRYGFVGRSGNQVSADAFTDGNLKKYILGNNTDASDLKNQMLRQSELTEKLDELVKDNFSMSLKDFQDTTKINLKISDGIVTWDDVTKSLNDLAYSTYDGVKVVMINTKDGVSYVTDIKNPTEEVAFINKLEEDLEKTPKPEKYGNMLNMALDSGRYVAIVKDANGVVTAVQLRQKSYSKEERTEFYKELLDRAKETADNNVKEGNVSNKTINNDWNDNFNKRFYLKATAGTFIDFKVWPDGNITLSIHNKAKGLEKQLVRIRVADLNEYIKDPIKVESLYEVLNNNDVVVEFNKYQSEKINLSGESVTRVFATTAGVSEIIEKTVTDINPNVRINKKLYLEYTSDLIEAEKIIPGVELEDQKGEVLTPQETAIATDKVSDINQIQAARESQEELNSDEITAKADIEKRRQEELDKLKENLENDLKEAEKEPDSAPKVKIRKADGSIDSNSIRQNSIEAANSLYKYGVNRINAKYDAELKELNNTAEQTSETLSLEDQIKKLENRKSILDKQINDEAKAQGVNRYNLKQSSEEYQQLDSEIKNLKSQRKNAFKIVNTPEALAEDLKIDDFINWAKRNLPDFIQIVDIAELKNKLKANGYTAGQFTMALRNIAGGVEVSGTIYTGPSSMIAYHEAFHSVFRMLLTDEEQTKLLKIAKDEVRAKFKTPEALMEDMLQFQTLSPLYKSMSLKRLEREYLEEYMADEFAKFKQNPRSTKTSSVIKSLFNRIIEWIKAALKRYSKNELINVFENIDAGKYKGGAVADNFYTKGLDGDITIEAYKAIPYESINGELFASELFLDPATSDLLIRMIANTYLERVSKAKTNIEQNKVKDQLSNLLSKYSKLNDEDQTEEITSEKVYIGAVIADYADLYYPGRDIYNGDKFSDSQAEKLEQIYKALTLDDGEKVADEVADYISLFDMKFEEINNEIDYLENSVGSRSVDQYGRENQEIGIQPSKKIRLYIASTIVTSKDMFGNTELLNGEPIKVAVKYQDVHNGLMLAAMNEIDPFKMITRMYYHSRRSLNTAAVLDRFLNDVGIINGSRSMSDVIDSGELPTDIKDTLLYHEFIKTYKNSRFDYAFHLKDKKLGKAIIISASQSDAATAQIDSWKKFHGDKFELFKQNDKALKQALSSVTLLASTLGKNKITNKELSALADSLSKNIFEDLGISFSRGFLEVSISSSIVNKTKYQKNLTEVGENIRLITKEDALQMVLALSVKVPVEIGSKVLKSRPENLFVDVEGKGVSSRLMSLALGNAHFDEAIGATVFTDVNGKLIYAHQHQTYHSRRIAQLNSETFLTELVEENAFLEKNILTDNLAFRQMAKDKMLAITRVSGTKNADLSNSQIDNLSDAALKEEGVTYGDMSSAEFINTLVDLYVQSFNTKNETNEKITYKNEEGFTETIAKAPVLLRIMEASNTNDLVSLPVIKTVSMTDNNEWSITDNALQLFANEIEREYNAIKENFKKGIQGFDGIDGYNDMQSDRSDKGRGFKFFKMDVLLNDENKKVYLEAAEAGLNFTEAYPINSLKTDLNKELQSLLDSFDIMLKDEKLATLQNNNKIKFNFSSLVTGSFPKTEKGKRAMEELNLSENDQSFNIAQIFLNNFLNTMAINQLILGEEARLFKDPFIDAIKRAKMQNTAPISVESYAIDKAKGINHTLGDDSISLITMEDALYDQVFTDKSVRGKGEKTDAQTYITSKGSRYFNYGLGQLTDAMVQLHNKIDAGEIITSEDWYGNKNNIGFLKAGAILNSQKYVYGDGQSFIKMSTVTLTKEETSDLVNGVWVAKIGMEELHNTREMMEEYEKTNPTKVAFLAPRSAVKMLKSRVHSLSRITDNKSPLKTTDVTPINAKDFGLQQVNPSNKLEVTLPNQIKSLITSEQKDSEIVIINGVPLEIGAIKKAYHKLTKEGVKFEFRQKKNLMFDLLPVLDLDILSSMEKDSTIDANLATFLRAANNYLKSSAAGSNMVEFFKTNKGYAKYELNNPITIKKFEQFFLAYFSKKVLAEKVTGHAFALKSGFGKSIIRKVYSLDSEGNIDKQDVIRRKVHQQNGNKEVTIDLRTENGFEQLKEALKNNSEGVTVIDRLRINLPKYNKIGAVKDWVATGERIAETIVPAHYKEVMDLIENWNYNKYGRIPDVIARMFVVRIPSQDKHSALSVEVVDFDPVFLGSTAVFPDELIEVSGADFDIDKVFAHIKEWYIKKGEFIEYGRSNATEEEKYDDYIYNSNKLINKKDSYLYDALYKYNTIGGSKINALKPKQRKELLKDKNFKEETLDALSMLNLPRTFKEYTVYKEKYGVEPYKAAINNQLLDLKMALVSNKAMTESINGDTPLAFQPADIEALKAEKTRLFNEFPQLKALSKDDFPIDSLIGQYYSHLNVKQNANLIGAVVPRNVVINFLKEIDVTLNSKWGEINVNDQPLTKFENFTKDSSGVRSQYLLSNLISAATDDAKERILSALGFNKDAIGIVETMLAMGLSVHTATMFVNVPVIRNAMKESDPSIIKTAISNVGTDKDVNVTDLILSNAINKTATPEELLGIYKTFNKFKNIKVFIDNLIPIFNLNTGFGKDFTSLEEVQQGIDELGIYLSDVEFNKNKLPFDIRNGIKNHYISGYLEIFNEFTEAVLPRVFLTQTAKFKELTSGIFGYSSFSASKKVKGKDQISKNVLAYVTIKAYMNQLFKNEEAASAIGGSLNNDFIYGNGNSNYNINTVFNNLRENNKGKSNYFLDYYASTQKASDKINTTGLNLLNSNSFGKLSDNEKVRIQNGFHQLYGEKETRADAVNIIHYVMIKDGLQYANGSILDALVPFTMENYLSASTKAFNVFKGNDNFEDVFGVSFEELKDEVITKYGRATSYASNIYKLSPEYLFKRKDSPFAYGEIKLDDTLTYTRVMSNDKSKPSKPLFKFPLFINRRVKDPINGNSEGYINDYYVLTNATLNGEDVMWKRGAGAIDSDKVTYVKYELEGAYKQNIIGFMFDNENYKRPTIKELIAYRQSLNDFSSYRDDFDDIPDFDDIDFEDILMEEAESNKFTFSSVDESSVVANEKGIAIDDINISDYKRPEGVEDAENKLLKFMANKSNPAQPATGAEYNYNPSNVSEQTREDYKQYVLKQLGKPEIKPKANAFDFIYPDLTITIFKDGSVSYPNVNQKIVDLSKTDSGYDVKFMVGLNKLAEESTQPSTSKTTQDISTFTNYSGGATGGDAIWASVGKEFGLGKQVDYKPDSLNKLSEEQKKEVEDAYQQAVKDLGRKPLAADSFAGGLVRRDYLQAKAADAVFAVGTIIESEQKDPKGYVNKTNRSLVAGGTGYAVQMAINLGKPVYVFDQLKNKWFVWENNKFNETTTPTLTKKFAGIGTREINKEGKQAIRDVYENTTQSSTSVKEGVQELFDSNPELANQVYEALEFTFKSKIETTKTPAEIRNELFSKQEQGQISLAGEDIDIISQSKNNPTEENIQKLRNLYNEEISRFQDSIINEITPQQKQQAQQQYSQYLDTIFPDSQIKDIAYHWARVPFELYDKSQRVALSSDLGEYLNLSVDPNTWKDYAAKTAKGEPVKQTYILNLKNPVITNDFYAKYFVGETERDQFKSGQEFWKFLEKNYDGILENQGEQLAVFNDEVNALRLGSEKDIQGFKDFVSQPSTSVSLPIQPASEVVNNRTIADTPVIQANEVEEQTDAYDEIDVEDILDNDTFDELNDLGMEFKNKFSSVENIDIKISEFYDEYIDGKKEAQESLKAARIGTTLEGFSESFKKSGFTKIEEYLDDQKCHIK